MFEFVQLKNQLSAVSSRFSGKAAGPQFNDSIFKIFGTPDALIVARFSREQVECMGQEVCDRLQ